MKEMWKFVGEESHKLLFWGLDYKKWEEIPCVVAATLSYLYGEQLRDNKLFPNSQFNLNHFLIP